MNLLAVLELGERLSSQIRQLFIACLASSSCVTRLYNSRDTVLGLGGLLVVRGNSDSYELDRSWESFVYWNLRLYWFFWMAWNRLGQAFQM